MKILFLLSIGLDRQATSGHLLNAIILALCKNGHSVHIVQKNTGGDLPPIPENLSQYPVTTDTIPFQVANKGNFIARYLKEVIYAIKCKKYIKPDYKAVFIQSTTIGGFIVRNIRKKLPHAIITFNVQDIFPYNLAYIGKIKKNGILFKFLSCVQRYAYQHSEHVITISEDMKDLLVEDGTPAERIEVIYNWSYQDEPYENVDLAPVTHMFNSSYFNVVYAGNIGLVQNVDIIIKTAMLLKDDKQIWFHIIGDGSHKEKLIRESKKLGLVNISFWSMQPSEFAPAIYSSADINVITLCKDVYRTCLPSKTAICIACGKPIIFAIGKYSKFLANMKQEPSYYCVESNDAKELANTIKKIKELKKRFKTEHSFYTKNMSMTKNSEKYAKIIVTGEFM